MYTETYVAGNIFFKKAFEELCLINHYKWYLNLGISVDSVDNVL